MPPSEKEKALLVTPYASTHNFHSDYSVVLDHPLSTTFPVLAHGDQMERMVRLSELLTEFELFDADNVVSPGAAPLAESHLRTEPPSTFESVTAAGDGLPRQYFRLQETVPLLFGLAKTKVEIVGTQTWDDNTKVALYESVTDQGIMVWKLRAFKEIEEDGTKKTSVIETIKGTCPGWMKIIVQRETIKAHRSADACLADCFCLLTHPLSGFIWKNTTRYSEF